MKKLFTILKESYHRSKAVFIIASVCFSFAFTALAIHLFTLAFPGFADFFNIHVAGAVRLVFAKITGVIPFSLGETVVLLLPLGVVSMFVFVGIMLKHDRFLTVRRFIALAFSLLSLFYTSFVFTLGTGYHGTSLDDKLGLVCRDLTSDELLEVSGWLAGKVNEAAKNVEFIYESSSVMPYSFEEMNDRLNEAYKQAAVRYPFIMGYSSKIKPVMSSALMTKAGLLGMYSYYTGESNVNVDYMDYNLVFTCAHEMAHQRGIAKENEANFIAFLVCVDSGDPYITYAGYLNMFEYMLNPLYGALKKEGSTAAYSRLLNSLDSRARLDIGLSNKKASENQGTVSNISNRINDVFIKSQGDEHGTDSYGLVIELAAAYYFDLTKAQSEDAAS